MLGYAARAAAYYNTSSLVIFVLQASFLVLAPAFYAASIYMTLSRIIRCVKGEHLSIIRVKWLSTIFVLGDLISLNIQGGGAGKTSGDDAKIGETLIITGLFIQLALLLFFFVAAIIFQIRLRKQPTMESVTTAVPWKSTLYMIYTVSTLIFLRSVFRVVEYLQGHDGYALSNEWTLYVFDAAPMFAVAVGFWYYFPGNIRPNSGSDSGVELENVRESTVGLRSYKRGFLSVPSW